MNNVFNKNFIVLVVTALFLCGSASTKAQGADLRRFVVSGGGGVGVAELSGGDANISLSVGQIAINYETNGSAIAFRGFWYPRMTATSPIMSVHPDRSYPVGNELDLSCEGFDERPTPYSQLKYGGLGGASLVCQLSRAMVEIRACYGLMDEIDFGYLSDLAL